MRIIPTRRESRAEMPDARLALEMAPRHDLPAWSLSLVLHALLFMVLIGAMRAVPRGMAVEADRSGGIVLVRQTGEEREYLDSQDAARTDDAQPASQGDLPSALPGDDQLPIDLATVLPGPGETAGSGAEVELPAAGELLQGTSATKALGGSVQTQIFGATGTGSKFVYVFDRSGSMDGYGGRPLRAAKSQLIASLRDLEPVHQFQIIFYNERPRVFQPDVGAPRLVWADERHQRLAAQFVAGIVAGGGTRHLEALELALGMHPDVIFFLTDADEPHLTPGELDRIRRWNRGSAIHAVEFGYGPSRGESNFLVRVAEQNGGTHTYVDLANLP